MRAVTPPPGQPWVGQEEAQAEARRRFDREADRLFSGPLSLTEAWAALRAFAAGSPLDRDELTGRAALAAYAAGRRLP